MEGGGRCGLWASDRRQGDLVPELKRRLTRSQPVQPVDHLARRERLSAGADGLQRLYRLQGAGRRLFDPPHRPEPDRPALSRQPAYRRRALDLLELGPTAQLGERGKLHTLRKEESSVGNGWTRT